MIQKYPFVSVVVPAYNRADLIVGAMESVFMQTCRPLELIIVDDGSTDDTRKRILEWAALHNKKTYFEVQYMYQENQGANAARNLGIQHAKGKLIAFIDSDDRWLPDKLEKQVPLFFNAPQVGAVYCGIGLIDLKK